MFSGIVQSKRPIIDITHLANGARFHIDLGEQAAGLQMGSSVSVSGVCLTVVTLKCNIASFDLIAETLRRTTLGKLSKGSLINIERSIRIGDEIGGHPISGHIDAALTIQSIETTNEQWILTLACDPQWMRFIFAKGFVALDGSSLTVVDVGRDWFTVHLIPETIRVTTFGEKRTGDQINLEIDRQTQAVVETVERVLGQRRSVV